MDQIVFAAIGKIHNCKKQPGGVSFRLEPIATYAQASKEDEINMLLVRRGLVFGDKLITPLPEPSVCAMNIKTDLETSSEDVSEGTIAQIAVSWSEILRFMDAAKSQDAVLHVDVIILQEGKQ